MRVLLVDDEPLTLEGIQHYMNWNDLGITSIETASNGLEGIEAVKRFKPHVVISDVRMPKMNGIEFASRIREILPDTKIIFLSGYSDKEYLKSAIQLQAVRYVEKPVKIEELTDAIRESVDQFTKEQRARNLTRTVVQQKWITKLIKENMTYTEFLRDSEPNEPPAFLSQAVIPIAILMSERGDGTGGKQSGQTDRVVEWLSDHFGEDAIVGYGEAFTLVCLCNESLADQESSAALSEHTLHELMDRFGDDFNFSIGMGPESGEDLRIGDACRQAINAAKLQFYKGSGKVYSYLQLDPPGDQSLVPDEALFREFRTALKQEQETKLLGIMDKLTGEIRILLNPDVHRVANYFFLLLMNLHEFTLEKGLSATEPQQEEKFIWQEIAGLSTLDSLRDYVIGNVEAVFSQLKERSAVSTRVAVILQYIQDHYSNTDLTTRSIAEHTYLSQTYMCALFKKETGKTINEYITEVRLEKAKALLQDRQMKLYEISQLIGFTDSNYFSSMFKKATGFTPSQFRERM